LRELSTKISYQSSVSSGKSATTAVAARSDLMCGKGTGSKHKNNSRIDECGIVDDSKKYLCLRLRIICSASALLREYNSSFLVFFPHNV
jgi:hypothetical protein